MTALSCRFRAYLFVTAQLATIFVMPACSAVIEGDIEGLRVAEPADASAATMPEEQASGESSAPEEEATPAAKKPARSDAGSDASAPPCPSGQGPTANGCKALVTCHRDADGDGFGDPVVVEKQAGGCATGWVTDATDCFDGSADVHPGQSAFFEKGYTKGGVVSFDYDCSGSEEEASPKRPRAGKPYCEWVGTVNGGCLERESGYLPATPVRQGTNINKYCGSTSYEAARCAGVLGLSCNTVVATDITLRPAIQCH